MRGEIEFARDIILRINLEEIEKSLDTAYDVLSGIVGHATA